MYSPLHNLPLEDPWTFLLTWKSRIMEWSKNRILGQALVGPLRNELLSSTVDKWARYAKKLDSKSFFSNTKSPFAFLNNEFWTRGLRNWQDMGHKSFINNGLVNTLLKSYFWLNRAVNHRLNISKPLVHNKKIRQ